MLAKTVALVAHELQNHLVAPVIAEYRNLDAPPACQRPHADGRVYDVASTTGGQTERAPTWDHDKRPPAVARVGFGRPANSEGVPS